MDDAADRLSPEGLLADSRWLHALARGLAGDAGAEDLVQDTWLSVLRRPPPRLTNLRPWLRTIARNLTWRDRASQARRRVREAATARPEAQPSTADLVARAVLRRSIVDAVLALAEPYRSTILLRFFEELPPREVARRQGIPVATVRTRVSRGLAQLRERLDRENGGLRDWSAAIVPVHRLIDASTPGGAALMATKAKVAGIAAAVILGAFGVWRGMGWWVGDEPVARVASAGAAGTLLAAGAQPGVAAASRDADIRADARVRITPFREPTRPRFAITGIAVDDRTGEPVEGVAATVVEWERMPPPAMAARNGVTDRTGAFRMEVEQPDRQRVRGVTLTSPDFAPLIIDHLASVHNAPGSALDLGTLRLLRGARVTGRVVSAETHEPIAGAELLLSPRRYVGIGNLLWEARPVGTSRADGTFTLSERVPPQVGEAATLTASTPAGIGWAYLSIVRDRESLEGVDVSVAVGAALRVTVVDERDQPISGARVMATPRFAPLGDIREYPHRNLVVVGQLAESGPLARFGAVTRADGTATLRGLPVGRVDALTDRYQGPLRAYDVAAAHPDFVVSAATAVDVDPAAEAALTIRLVHPKVRVLRGRVTTETGAAIAGAHIGNRGSRAFLVTDRDGTYRSEEPQTGTSVAYLEVGADGFALSTRDVAFAPTAAEVVADFVLRKAMPIAGRVIDEEGRPGAAYVDLSDGGDGAAAVRWRPDGNGDLDAAGRFVFSNATAGPWLLDVMPPVPVGDWVPLRPRVVQGGDQNVDVVLRRRAPGGARLEAAIVDATSGLPLDPAEAHVFSAAPTFSGDRSAIPQPQRAMGRVTSPKIPPGTWKLSVRVADGSRASHTFTVAPADTVVRFQVEIGKPATIIVKVNVDAMPPDARPSRVIVWTWPGSAAQCMEQPGKPARNVSRGVGIAEAANDWTLQFEDVTPNEPIRFWTTSEPAGNAAECDVTVGFGEERQVVLRPVPRARLVFRKPAGAVSGGVHVTIKRADGTWGEPWSDVWRDGTDWKWTRDVVPGRVAWRAQRYALDGDPEGRTAAAVVEGEVDIAAGASRDIPIVFPK